jgi:serine protease
LLFVAGAVAAAPGEGRLIVKLRDSAAKALYAPEQRALAAGAEAGVPLRYLRAMAVGAHLVGVSATTPDALRAQAAVLAAHPDVEYAVPDRRMKPLRTANDEFINAQTYLAGDGAGISVGGAWDVTTGSAQTVVAVIDSGYRPHADLAGRLLPGYDFVSDPDVANDGDGRDADPSDPGDWIDASDLIGAFSGDGCTERNSSWHGTAVAGVIAANANNHAWTAGIDWSARILPVRVLGKCGGSLSDTVDGIAWAAGLAVPGVPANPTPAAIVNLSLGDHGACSAPEQSVIAAALAHGVTRAIVVAAGNDSQDVANDTPASCAGVIAVAATTSRGKLASYSNFGAGITVSAPGGDYNGHSGGPDGIIALSNQGTTAPAADGIAIENGTSFSAPVVAGVVSLMLAVAPQLTAQQVRSLIATSVKPFPAGSDCDPTLCGPGIIDATAAVKAAQALSGAAATTGVVEYYWAARDHYFITAAPAEIGALDAMANGANTWVRTGLGFRVYAGATGHPDANPVCRIYIPPPGDSHFFSASPAECASTLARFPTLEFEAASVFAIALPDATGSCAAGLAPVYRVFDNRADPNHRYTNSRAVRDAMVAKGYVAEGAGPDAVTMCGPP